MRYHIYHYNYPILSILKRSEVRKKYEVQLDWTNGLPAVPGKTSFFNDHSKKLFIGRIYIYFDLITSQENASIVQNVTSARKWLGNGYFFSICFPFPLPVFTKHFMLFRLHNESSISRHYSDVQDVSIAGNILSLISSSAQIVTVPVFQQ